MISPFPLNKIKITKKFLRKCYSLLEIWNDVESGGKILGYISNEKEKEIVLIDFIPPGPGARLTPIAMEPDNEYQREIFQKVVSIDHKIEHLGSWHTHHPNGLQDLSKADIKGYIESVNSSLHRHDFFFVGLIKFFPLINSPINILEVFDFYLFERKSDYIHKINKSIIEIVDNILYSGFIYTSFEIEITNKRNISIRNDIPQENRIDIWANSDQSKEILLKDKNFLTNIKKKYSFDFIFKKRGNQMKFEIHGDNWSLHLIYPKNRLETAFKIKVYRDFKEIIAFSFENSDFTSDFINSIIENLFI